MVSWIKHSVDRFVIVSIFIPKLRLILILNSFLGSSDSLVFSELFHSLAPRPLAARSRSEERFSRNAETELVCRLLLEKKNSSGIRTKSPGQVNASSDGKTGLLLTYVMIMVSPFFLSFPPTA